MMKKKGFPPVLVVALVLLCLVLVTAHFTTGMYARYTTRSGGNDESRIARFKVSASDGGLVEITPDATSGTYTFTLSNPGEVTVRYKAEVVFDNSADADRFTTVSPMELTGEIAPRSSVEKSIGFDMSGRTGQGEIPFTVVVTFTQVD